MQVLLIYKLGNKNHLKNINDQNFAHFMGVTTKAFTVFRMEIGQSSDYNKDRSLCNTIKSIREEIKGPYDYVSTFKINLIYICLLNHF